MVPKDLSENYLLFLVKKKKLSVWTYSVLTGTQFQTTEVKSKSKSKLLYRMVSQDVLGAGRLKNVQLPMGITLKGVTYKNVIYIQSNEIHNVIALVKCLLVLRYQLHMFLTVTVHPQEPLCRYCMCRLWYVLIRLAGTTFLPKTLYQPDISAHTIACTYSIYKEVPDDGPLRSETCAADT